MIRGQGGVTGAKEYVIPELSILSRVNENLLGTSWGKIRPIN